MDANECGGPIMEFIPAEWQQGKKRKTKLKEKLISLMEPNTKMLNSSL